MAKTRKRSDPPKDQESHLDKKFHAGLCSLRLPVEVVYKNDLFTTAVARLLSIRHPACRVSVEGIEITMTFSDGLVILVDANPERGAVLLGLGYETPAHVPYAECMSAVRCFLQALTRAHARRVAKSSGLILARAYPGVMYHVKDKHWWHAEVRMYTEVAYAFDRQGGMTRANSADEYRCLTLEEIRSIRRAYAAAS